MGTTTQVKGDAAATRLVFGADSRMTNARPPTEHAATHLGSGADAIAAATQTARGTVTTSTASSKVASDDDARLSDARTPTAHAASHKSGGSDAVKLDELAAPTDVTTLNATTALHGLLPKLGGGTTNFLREDGTWAAPPGGGVTLAQVYPVGSVYIAVVSTSPATLFGFGTWAAFATGRVIVGFDAAQTEFDVAEETGGAKTVTLTTAEMPVHTHAQDAHTHNFLPRSATSGSVSSIVTGTLDTSSAISGANQPHVQAATAVNQNAGGGGAHNNLQPYIVAYVWKRTA